jgi:hypothetical protein
VLFALKLVLVPALIAAVSLGGRRWGPRIGGWLNAMPLVAGPVLLFLAVEQGVAFAARAATATLAGLVGVAAFAAAYGWAALRLPWWGALLAGWGMFTAVTLLLHGVSWRPLPAVAAAAGSFGLARLSLPHARGPARRPAPPPWDLAVRMAAAVALVLTVTGLANVLGPRLSGALTPLPVATAILLGFTHAQEGTSSAIVFLRAFLPAMWGFVLFCFVLTLALVPLGWEAAFLIALAVQGAAQGLMLVALRARAKLG